MVWSTPRTWTTGETVTASIMNTHVRDQFKAIGDPWTAYTPGIGGWTKGNGTITGKYMQAGKFVAFKIIFTFGSTSVATGTLAFDLPVSVADAGTAGFPLDGNGWVLDTSASASTYYYPEVNTAGTGVRLRTAAGALVIASTIAWATGDMCAVVGSYEAA